MLSLNKKTIFLYFFSFLLCLTNIQQLLGTIWLTRIQAESLAVLIKPEFGRSGILLDNFIRDLASVRYNATEGMSKLYKDDYAHFLSDEAHFLTAVQVVATALSDQSTLSEQFISADLAKKIIFQLSSFTTNPQAKEITDLVINAINQRSTPSNQISHYDIITLTAMMEDLLIHHLPPQRRDSLLLAPSTPLALSYKIGFALRNMENAIRNTLIMGWGNFHQKSTGIQYIQEPSCECARLTAIFKQQVSPFITPHENEVFFQILLLTTTTFLEECTTLLHKLQNDLQAGLSSKPLCYPHHKFFSLWCQCPCATFSERMFAIASIVTDIQLKGIAQARPLVYTSVGSGHFFQDYLTLKVLYKLGYKNAKIHLIDPVYDPTNPNYASAKTDVHFLLEKLQSKTSTQVVVHDLDEKVIETEESKFYSAHSYYEIYLHPSASTSEIVSSYPLDASLAVCTMVDTYLPDDFNSLFEASREFVPIVGWILEKNTLTNYATKASYRLHK